MSFLHPALLAGALAVGVPLWLHLRAKSGAVFLFPTLRFLEDQPRPRSRGFRLRDVLLFLVRAAAVILLAAGFAWPYRDRGTRVVESRVHLIDATLSRRADDGFARDRERVRRTLLEGGADAQDAVIVLTGRPRVLVSFTDDRVEAAQRVAALEPAHARGAYVEAFRLAQSVLAQSLGSRRRILVYADHQENQWTENETSPPFLEGVEVEVVEPPARAVLPNLSVGEPAVRRFFLGDRAFVDLAAELRHDGALRTAHVRLAANGARILEDDLALEGETGITTLRGQWSSDPGQWLRGEISIDHAKDALGADDRVYFALPPVLEGRLALAARSPYLRAALAPDTMKGRWATTVIEPGALRVEGLREDELPEVLVLESDYAQSQAVRALALRCLNNGRGVVLFVRRETPLVKGFLAELGVEVLARRAAGEETFRLVAGDHPIFRPFLNGELGDVSVPRVFEHVALQSSQAVPLLFGTSGDPLLLEGTATKGRLLLFAFGLDRTQTDWPLQPSFLPFLDIALQHARQGTPVQTSAAPGELVTHVVPSDRAAAGEIALRRDGRELARVPVDENRSARFEAPELPGIYEVTYASDPAVQALVAVNPSPKESVLRYRREPAALKTWTMAAEAADPDRRAAVPARLTAADDRLWWWCLVAAAAALALETMVLAFAPRGRTA